MVVSLASICTSTSVNFISKASSSPRRCVAHRYVAEPSHRRGAHPIAALPIHASNSFSRGVRLASAAAPHAVQQLRHDHNHGDDVLLRDVLGGLELQGRHPDADTDDHTDSPASASTSEPASASASSSSRRAMRLRVQAHAKHGGSAAANHAMQTPLLSAAAEAPLLPLPHGQWGDLGTEHVNGVGNGAALAAWVPAASVHSRYALKKQQSMLASGTHTGTHSPDNEAAPANGVPEKPLPSLPFLPPVAALPPPASAVGGGNAVHAGGPSAAQPNSTDRTGRRGKRRAQHPEPTQDAESHHPAQSRHPSNTGPQPGTAASSLGETGPDDLVKARASQLQQLQQRQLTVQISKARSWVELADLFVDHRPDLNPIHVSAMLVRLAHLETAPRSGGTAELATGGRSGARPLDVQPPSGRLATSAEPSGAPGRRLIDTAVPVGRPGWIAPQNRRQVLKLRKLLKGKQQHLDLELDSGLSRPAGAPLSSGSMGATSSSGSQAGVAGRRDDLPAQWPPPSSLRKCPTHKHLVRALCREADARLGGMGLRELSAALAAALKLRCPLDKPAVLRYMTRAFHVLGEDGQRQQQRPGSGVPARPPKQPPKKAGRPTPVTVSSSGEQRHQGNIDLPTTGVTAQSLSELIWSVSGFGMQGLRPDWASRFLGAVALHCGEFSAQGIAVLLHSLAALGHMPSPELRQQLLERLLQLAEEMGEGSGSSRGVMMDGAAKKQQPQPGRQQRPRHQGLAPADVSMTFRALAVLRTRPPGDLGDRLLLATQRLLPAFSAQELANTAWGLAKLRMPPPSAAWSSDFCEAAATTILGGAQLGTQPGRDSTAVNSVAVATDNANLHGELQAAPGRGPSSRTATTSEEPAVGTSRPAPAAAAIDSGAQALSMTLYSMALLRLRPDEAFMGACLRYTSQHYGSFTIQGLSSVVYALALMGYHPSRPWLLHFHSGIDSFRDIPPASMAMLHKAYSLLHFSPVSTSPAAAAAPATAPVTGPGGRKASMGGSTLVGPSSLGAGECSSSSEDDDEDDGLDSAGWVASATSSPYERGTTPEGRAVSRPSRFAAR